MALSPEDKERLLSACHEAMNVLLDSELIEEPTLFETIANVCIDYGYDLVAEQQGARGTMVYFRKIKPSEVTEDDI